MRDKLVNGELDFAHVLYGLVYGVHLGVGGAKKDMAVLMRSEEHTSELQSQSNLVCRIMISKKHTSELQSQSNLVCRLLLEKKKISYDQLGRAHVLTPVTVKTRMPSAD